LSSTFGSELRRASQSGSCSTSTPRTIPPTATKKSSYYYGFYEEHIYHPLLVFDGEMGQLIAAVLRCGNTHSSRGTVAILGRIVARLREAWPEVEIELRADAGFAVPAIYEHCEKEGITYAIGLITNPRLEALCVPLPEEAQERYGAKGEKIRLISEGRYRAGSWDEKRRAAPVPPSPQRAGGLPRPSGWAIME
jgi:hypothetical protein